jgi:hypothetical protein
MKDYMYFERPCIGQGYLSFFLSVHEGYYIVFFSTKEELYYMIAGYINTLQLLWITK